MSNTVPSNPSVNTSSPGAGPQAPLQPGSNTFSPIPSGCIPVSIQVLPVTPMGQQVLPGESPQVRDRNNVL